MGLKFECNALAGVNKVGQLQKDKDGYYHVTLAALNFFNAAGIFYDYELSQHVFTEKDPFTRKMLGGKLYSEVEHPEPPIKDPQHPQFMDAYIGRNRFIDMRNTCGHIRGVEVNPINETCNGKVVYLITGWIKPEGVHAAVLQSLLDNPHANVCFSLRSIINDRPVNGVRTRQIEELITFDLVSEGGLSKATKYLSPGLECFAEGQTVEFDIPMDCLERLRNQELAKQRLGRECDVQSVERLIAAARRDVPVLTRKTPLLDMRAR